MEAFLSTVGEFFPEKVLQEFSDDWGVTFNADKEMYRIGYAVNLSPEVIEKAANADVDLLVTHHDAWDDILYGMKETCQKLLQKNSMSHFYVHGPLDFSWFGTAPSLAVKVGAEVITHSGWETQETPAVAGLPQPLSLKSLSDRIQSVLGEPVRVWKNNDKKIERIGILTGAGNLTGHLKYANDQNCDTYITGEATLYSIQYAEFLGLNMIVGSHTYTELFGVETFAKKVAWVHPETEVVHIEEQHLEAGGMAGC
ncbi:Nif3-like dinuclear metal center hexameric protein [Alteribacter natronophilus]|uniref:Nif3-like dinuclear metal center hexameric protein n=1 Tax=Alteribacter natronophilus TaxID=2583810 RepID=UPI001FE90290|nr:Nif3-like dinuclear metal center hexameric protein [Alteribacter natronophilus]